MKKNSYMDLFHQDPWNPCEAILMMRRYIIEEESDNP
jgi:hypothetical protein